MEFSVKIIRIVALAVAFVLLTVVAGASEECDFDEPTSILRLSRILTQVNRTQLVQVYSARGREYLWLYQLDKAIDDFGTIIYLEPGDVEGYIYRGVAYGLKGDYIGATKNFKQALLLDPGNKHALHYLDLSSDEKNNYGMIIGQNNHEKHIKTSDESSGDYKIGDAGYTLKENYERATKELQNKIGFYLKKTMDKRTCEELNKVMVEKFRGIVAEEIRLKRLTNDITLHPDNASKYEERAGVYEKNGDYESAIKDFTMSIQLKPKNPNPYFRRAEDYRLVGDFERAVEDFSMGVILLRQDRKEIYERGYEYYGHGNAHEWLGDYDKAIEDYGMCIKLFTNENLIASVFLDRGDVYYEKGNYEKAVKDYTYSLTKTHSREQAYGKRGKAYNAMGLYDKAIRDFKEALENTDNPNTIAYYFRAWAFFKKGDFMNAVSDCSTGFKNHLNATIQGESMVYMDDEFQNALDNCEVIIKSTPEISGNKEAVELMTALREAI